MFFGLNIIDPRAPPVGIVDLASGSGRQRAGEGLQGGGGRPHPELLHRPGPWADGPIVVLVGFS